MVTMVRMLQWAISRKPHRVVWFTVDSILLSLYNTKELWDPQRLHAQYPEMDNDIVHKLVKN